MKVKTAFANLRSKLPGTQPSTSVVAGHPRSFGDEGDLSRDYLIELNSVHKTYGNVSVLKNIDLKVHDGEFLTVIGPSGSGKTTILRMIGGFIDPTSGSILFEGQDIGKTPINRRPFNTVFQDYALFPHMTVAQNVGYGLLVRGIPKHEIAQQTGKALELVKLGDFADRYPLQMSGGQRQRVALARAIICQPRLILLDEPLGALDVELRKQMQIFLKDIHREIRTTFLLVTHDQEEAISMADRICVINDGQILQIARPHEVYYRPQTEFVARFFGDNNLVPGRLLASENSTRRIETSIGTFVCEVDGQPNVASADQGREAFAVFRPEVVTVGDVGKADNQVVGKVLTVRFAGETTVAEVAIGTGNAEIKLHIKVQSRIDGIGLTSGDSITLNWRARECRLVLI